MFKTLLLLALPLLASAPTSLTPAQTSCTGCAGTGGMNEGSYALGSDHLEVKVLIVVNNGICFPDCESEGCNFSAQVLCKSTFLSGTDVTVIPPGGTIPGLPVNPDEWKVVWRRTDIAPCANAPFSVTATGNPTGFPGGSATATASGLCSKCALLGPG